MTRGRLVRHILVWSSIAMAALAVFYVVEDRLGTRV